MSEELVLVVKKEVIEAVGEFQKFTSDTMPYLEKIFTPGVAFFIPRSEAETDPNYKQIIPYVLIHDPIHNTYLSYRRGKKGAEKRLVGNISIGIGGHINSTDLSDTPKKLYNTAVQREIHEEVKMLTGYVDYIVGLLYDDSNAVGQVHLGIVHELILLPEIQSLPYVLPNEEEISELTFKSIEELKECRDDLEMWSQICLDNIKQIRRKSEQEKN